MKVKNCTLIKPLSCKAEANVVDVAKTLRDAKQRRIIVVDSKEHPVGIISTTDMNNKVVAEGRDASKLKAGDIMVSPIFVVADYEDAVSSVYTKMLEHKSFFVPITKNKKLYAVLTYGELVNRVHEVVKNAA